MKNVDLPLLNKRVVVTRAEGQSENISLLLKKAGATVIPVPTIRIVPTNLSPEDESHVHSFYEYNAVIFSSANSVRNLLPKISTDEHRTTKPYIVAIGEKTAEAISEFGIAVDFVPGKSTSEELMNSLAGFDWNTKKVLIPVGNLSNNELADFVRSKGGVVDQVIVYETLPNDSIPDPIKSEIQNKKFDIIIFYSPSQVRNFNDIFGVEVLKEKQIAVIGPTTKKAVEHYNLDVAIIPDNSTTEDLITTLLEHEKI
jgi:uroporphyrinogen-III synthase